MSTSWTPISNQKDSRQRSPPSGLISPRLPNRPPPVADLTETESRTAQAGSTLSTSATTSSIGRSDRQRGGWDTQARENDGFDNGYDRRISHDYSRRGRSPDGDMSMSRKRGRSISPYGREPRYDARPRYNDDYDGERRGYEYERRDRRHGDRRHYERQPPQDPYTAAHPLSLKQFAEWYRYFHPQQATEEDSLDRAAEPAGGESSRPRNGIRSKWEQYRKEFSAGQLQILFDHHSKSPWFMEKYDPASNFVELRRRIKREGWAGRLGAFLRDLEAGKFDPESESTANGSDILPPSPIKENANDGVFAADESKVEDEMQFGMDQEEDGVDGDTGRPDSLAKNAEEKSDQISVLPEGNQVLIRTIPPDIGRVKLEESLRGLPNFTYLALGDPMQKRNYYRAGWIKFGDEADMAALMTILTDRKVEGFRLHVTHNVRPFTTKVRIAPSCTSQPEQLAKDLEKAKALASVLENRRLDLYKPTDVTMADGSAPDTSHDPSYADEPLEQSGSAAVDKRAEEVVANMLTQGLINEGDDKELELQKTTVTLDLYIAYLRAAYHTCYYCAVTTDHLEELQRKCLKHIRKPLPPAQEPASKDEDTTMQDVETGEIEPTTNDVDVKNGADGDKEQSTLPPKPKDAKPKERETGSKEEKRTDHKWLEWHESKVALLLDPDTVNPRAYGGKKYDDELAKLVEPHMKQEDEGKYRCKACNKLFKASSFVEKHIVNKHKELVKGLDEIPYFNNFALDPHRITPFTHVPPATSGGQQLPPQAWGIKGVAPAPNDHGRSGNSNHGYAPNNHVDLPYQPSSYPVTGGIYPAPGIDQSLAATAMSSRPLKDTGNRRNGGRGQAPMAPPPNAKEDPRAKGGKALSYYDMDSVAEGDIELSY